MPSGIYKRTPEILAKLKSGMLGKHHSEKTKEKLRHNIPTQFKKGHPAPKTAFQKGNKKLSNAHSFPKGEKHPRWRGGITPINKAIRCSIEYKIWRKAVFERDNYTCVWCGEKEKVSGKLNADHIKPFAFYPELRFAIDNGRTLCINCHHTTNTWGRPKTKYEN